MGRTSDSCLSGWTLPARSADWLHRADSGSISSRLSSMIGSPSSMLPGARESSSSMTSWVHPAAARLLFRQPLVQRQTMALLAFGYAKPVGRRPAFGWVHAGPDPDVDRDRERSWPVVL
jgi:hypothetical protein